MLEKEFDWYLKNQDKLVKSYEGKHIVIVGKKVVGSYNSIDEAVKKSKEKYKIGTFLVQFCDQGSDAYTSTFHSRVFYPV